MQYLCEWITGAHCVLGCPETILHEASGESLSEHQTPTQLHTQTNTHRHAVRLTIKSVYSEACGSYWVFLRGTLYQVPRVRSGDQTESSFMVRGLQESAQSRGTVLSVPLDVWASLQTTEGREVRNDTGCLHIIQSCSVTQLVSQLSPHLALMGLLQTQRTNGESSQGIHFTHCN